MFLVIIIIRRLLCYFQSTLFIQIYCQSLEMLGNTLKSLIRNEKTSNSIIFPNKYFQNTIVRFAGRKTGSKALEPAPREFSKKQKKRKSVQRLLMSEKRDPKTEKIKSSMMKKQLDSKEMHDFVEKTDEK